MSTIAWPATTAPSMTSTVSATQADFFSLVTANQGIIHKVCRLYCDSPEDRRDLFQEILLQLWRAYGAYRGEAKFTTWMYRVALNTAISSFRKEKRRPGGESIDSLLIQIPEPEPDGDREEKIRFLYQAIQQLSKIERAIIMLYLEENSYDEIAEVVGITRNHVGVKINRIKTKLKQLLEPHFV